MIDLHDRLQQMIADDPLGEKAAALLQRLSLSNGPISRRTLTVLAPKGMSRLMRGQAFSTLIKWGFAAKNAHHDIVLSEGVQKLFPEDIAVFETPLTYLEHKGPEYWLLELIGEDGLVPFCQRFIRTHPIAVLRLIVAIRSFDNKAVIADGLAALELIPDPLPGYWSLQSIADQRRDTQLKQIVLEKMLTLYEQRQNIVRQQYVLIQQGDNARERNDTPLMLRSYEKAVALDPINRQLTLGVFSLLIDHALKTSQHKEALQYFAYAQIWAALPRFGRNQSMQYVDSLAVLAEKVGLYDVARACYARYAQAGDNADGLWHWAEFEHRRNQHEESRHLFALSMIALRKMYDSRDVDVDIDKLWQIRIQAIRDLGYEVLLD